MTYSINNIKIIQQLPSGIIFEAQERPITYQGRQYQLLIGYEKNSKLQRIISVIQAFILTILTAGIALLFQAVRKEWGMAFGVVYTIKRYMRVFSAEIDSVERTTSSLNQTISSITIQSKNVEAAAKELSQQFIHRYQQKTEDAADLLQSRIPATGETSIFREEELDQLLDLSDRARLTLIYHEQYGKLIQRLDSLRSLKDNSDIWNVPGLIPQSVRNPDEVLSDAMIDQIVTWVQNYFQNQDALADLKQKILNELGNTSFLDQAIKQFENSALFKGRKLFDEGIKLDLFNIAKRIQAQEQFDDLLTKIQTAAQRDLYIDDNHIENKFGVKAALKSLTVEEQKVRRENLQKIINTAYLQRELREKGKHVTGQRFEVNLLSIFKGHKIEDKSAYYDKDQIYLVLKKIIGEQLKADHYTGSNVLFRETFKECALRARLKMVGITAEHQINKFQLALPLVQEVNDRLTDITATIPMILPTTFPLHSPSLAIQSIEESFQILKKRNVGAELKKIFNYQEIKNFFTDNRIDKLSFKSYLEVRILAKRDLSITSLREACENDKQHEVLTKKIEFYSKWGKYLKFEMIQGFSDSNEVLGRGVCLAVCFRMLAELQLNPELAPEMLAEKEKQIKGIDRFRQALYKTKPDLYLNQAKKQKTIDAIVINKVNALIGQMPQELLDKHGFIKDQQLFEIDYDPEELDFNKKFTIPSNIEKLKKTNGWIHLGLQMQDGGHAVLMCVDFERQKAWFFDPNVGFLCFEETGKTFENATKDCLECFKENCMMLYPSLYKVSANQLLPK